MLTLENYDIGVKNFIKARYKNTVWGNTQDAFSNAAKEFGDKVYYPLISVFRSDMALGTNVNYANLRSGRVIETTPTKVKKEKVIDFLLSYEIDIWSTESSKGMELFCELLFRLKEKPVIEIPHQGMDAPLIKYPTVTEIVDNTDTSQILTKGRLSRFTILMQMNAHIAKLVEDDRINIVPEVGDFSGRRI